MEDQGPLCNPVLEHRLDGHCLPVRNDHQEAASFTNRRTGAFKVKTNQPQTNILRTHDALARVSFLLPETSKSFKFPMLMHLLPSLGPSLRVPSG